MVEEIDDKVEEIDENWEKSNIVTQNKSTNTVKM
jgi:hypothetical protein